MSDKETPGGRFERVLIPVVIILFCVAAFYVSTTFKKMPPVLKRGIQPSDFPQLLLVFIVVMTAAMVVFDPIRIRDRLQGTVWGTLLLFGLFAVLTSIDLFIALAVFAACLAALWGERRVMVLGLVGLVVPLLVFLLFDQLFEIRFPRGVVTNLWYG